MKVQVIEKDGRPEWAVIPYTEYERLLEAAEDLEDVRDYDAVKQALASGSEELVPGAVADRLLDGENPVRVWRKHRGLSVSNLAAACGLTPAAVSQIENGKRSPSIETVKAIAAALNIEVDDII
ncbi:MAG: helix-turn-helix transcriptional regulator [Syntrophobacteraceae bacterium]